VVKVRRSGGQRFILGLLLAGATSSMASNADAPLPAPLVETSSLMQAQTPHDERPVEFSVEGGFEALPSYFDDLNAAHVAAAESVWRSGMASWYSHKFHGRRTASGEPYLRHGWTVAHREWPLGSKIAIRNPANGVEVTAKVNDRGPFHPNRLIDVSFAVAKALDIVQQGVALVEVRLLEEADVSFYLNDSPSSVSSSKQSLKPPPQWPPKTK
jgi:rare lipoprotein A (peptidoglycan hydrolase)